MARHSILLIVVLVVLFVWASDRTTTPRVMTGTVAEWQPGKSISVENEQSDRGGLKMTLRDTTYEGDRDAIRRGARVTVWYAMVGERHPVAAKIRVLSEQRLTGPH